MPTSALLPNVIASTPQSPNFIFKDGFESGSLSYWSWADTDAGNLSVSPQAVAIGNYGMQTVINDTISKNVYYQTAAAQAHYSARFYFNPHSIQIPAGQGVHIFAGSNSQSSWVNSLYLQQAGQNYSLSACGKDETIGNFSCTSAVSIPNSWQAVEIEWKTASSPSIHDGYLKLWVDDTLVVAATNLNNDAELVSYVSMGIDDAPVGAAGTMYFDEFESWKGEHIGLDPNGPALQPPLSNIPALTSMVFEPSSKFLRSSSYVRSNAPASSIAIRRSRLIYQ